MILMEELIISLNNEKGKKMFNFSKKRQINTYIEQVSLYIKEKYIPKSSQQPIKHHMAIIRLNLQ